ncbi:MAG: phospho-N-acetylmuramoyl-pentapeptide-transferase [Chitinophagales bacterium]
MLYYLFEWLNQWDVPGAGLFQFISFRAAIALMLSLLMCLIFGKKWIAMLQRMQVKETVRDLGLKGEKAKQGTPTMGGVIIIFAILIPTLLVAKFDNVYIWLMVLATVWMGAIGFTDDYIKVFKKDKKGLAGRFKILGQVGFGLIIGLTMYFNNNVYVQQDITNSQEKTYFEELERFETEDGKTMVKYKAPITDIPFFKTYYFHYGDILWWLGENYHWWAWLIYIPAIIFIVTAVSNAANLTDGIDGLAAGLSAIAGVCLGLFAYFSGNTIVSDYLHIMYLPNTSELVVFSAAFVGACIGFLWFNAYPAQIFMGDTGSLTLGGIIAALAIAVRKELLIPILCGIFLLENLSVVLQVAVFKYRKKKHGLKYAQENRLFLMSPLHHHYQKKGIPEAKIVTRFWIVGIMLAVLTFITLKVR